MRCLPPCRSQVECDRARASPRRRARRCGRRGSRRPDSRPRSRSWRCRASAGALKPGQARGMQGSTMRMLGLAAEPEDALDAGTVHPAGRAGVPGPAAAADMLRRGVDVGRHDVGLDLVARDAPAFESAWLIGLSMRNSAAGLVALAERGEGEHHPDRGMGVLAAVLAKARRIALDVARVGGVWSKGGVNRRASPSSRRTSSRLEGGHGARRRARARRPARAPPRTARSSRSGTRRCSAEPSGVPSSK